MNILLMNDQHVVDAIDSARQDADDALDRYVEAHKRIAELQAIRDLRVAMGADVANTIKIERLREQNTA